MVFFVLLFTMGSMDKNLLMEFQMALQSGLGILGSGSRVSVAVQQSKVPFSKQEQLIQANNETAPDTDSIEADKIHEMLGGFAAQPGVKVRYSKEGIHFSFEDALFFNFGRADINSSGFAFLNNMTALLRKVPYAVRVEGHSDNVPIRTKRFPSNWELSIARAVSVVKYFVEVGKINPQRFSAVGYGESRPLVPNNSPANLSTFFLTSLDASFMALPATTAPRLAKVPAPQ